MELQHANEVKLMKIDPFCIHFIQFRQRNLFTFCSLRYSDAIHLKWAIILLLCSFFWNEKQMFLFKLYMGNITGICQPMYGFASIQLKYSS